MKFLILILILVGCSDKPIVVDPRPTPLPTPIITATPTPVPTVNPFGKDCTRKVNSTILPAKFGTQCEGGYFANWTTTGYIIMAPPSTVKKLAVECSEVQEKWSDGRTGGKDGLAFTKRLIIKCTKSPAAHYCNNLVVNGYDDWYLPSFGELDPLLGTEFRKLGYDLSWYWTSAKGCGGKSFRKSGSGGFNMSGTVNDFLNVVCVRHSSMYGF